MLLKSLKMKDFRQYKGVQEVFFSTDLEKNVTVILGNNTFGKTTLLQAFNWCFYQKVMLDNPELLLNLDVASELPNGYSAEVEVEIELVHSGIEYKITTSQDYTREGSNIWGGKALTSVCYIREDGQTEPIGDTRVRSIIQSILPEGLSNFFFFDTERVSSVSSRDDLTSSVKSLLGLAVLDEALLHIGDREHKRSVIGQFYEKDLDLDGDEEAKTALAGIQKAQEEKEDNQARMEECDSQINRLIARKEQLDDILRNNANVKELQKRKEILESELQQDSTALAKTRDVLRKDFNRSSIEYFVVPLIDQAEQVIHEAELDDKGIKDLTRPTLEEIIARNVCVCGLKLDEHPDAIRHIREEMKYCPPESIGNSIRNYREKLEEHRGDQDAILAGINDRRSNVCSAISRIQNNSDEIDVLSEQIGQKDDLSSFENERNQIKVQLKIQNAKRDSLIRGDGRLKNLIDKYQDQYARVNITSSKNQQIMQYIGYAEAIQQWLQETYSEKEIEVRDALQERVNSIFEEMYHGTRKVVIDSKYHVNLLTSIANNDISSGESEGLNRVKNFAFIAGLVSLAKERIVSDTGSGEFDLSSEPYPLVMDAPFSNADETHIANISKVLPEASEQVIMFVMMKDWRYAETVLSAKVGARYQLDKLSEQHSVLRG